MNYQQLILDRLSGIAEAASLTVSRSMNFANTGRLIVTRPDLTTVVTADFDFQSDRVHLVINNKSRGDLSAPRDDRHFWWTPGDPTDDGEVARLMNQWQTFMPADEPNALAHRWIGVHEEEMVPDDED